MFVINYNNQFVTVCYCRCYHSVDRQYGAPLRVRRCFAGVRGRDASRDPDFLQIKEKLHQILNIESDSGFHTSPGRITRPDQTSSLVETIKTNLIQI